MHSSFANLYEIECASQHYHGTLENISIWDITVVSEHVPCHLWEGMILRNHTYLKVYKCWRILQFLKRQL